MVHSDKKYDNLNGCLFRIIQLIIQYLTIVITPSLPFCCCYFAHHIFCGHGDFDATSLKKEIFEKSF